AALKVRAAVLALPDLAQQVDPRRQLPGRLSGRGVAVDVGDDGHHRGGGRVDGQELADRDARAVLLARAVGGRDPDARLRAADGKDLPRERQGTTGCMRHRRALLAEFRRAILNGQTIKEVPANRSNLRLPGLRAQVRGASQRYPDRGAQAAHGAGPQGYVAAVAAGDVAGDGEPQP